MGLVKYLIVLLLFIPSLAFADTHNASSCSRADVTSAITAASNGDTVSIPTCEGTDGTWTSGITLSADKLLTLQGAGKTNTVISHGAITAISLVGAHRITGIGFKLTSSGGYHIEARRKGWRIDHCSFTNLVGTSQYSIQANGTNETEPPEGLIDNNEFMEGRILVAGMGTFLKNSTVWAADLTLGTGNTVYIEDNTFHKTVSQGGNVIDIDRAAHYVARYNTVTGNTQFMVHGWQDEDERGARKWEIYGNTFTASASPFAAVWMRAGTGIIAYNQFSGDYDYDIVFDDNRAAGTCWDCDIVGLCNGASYADGAAANGYPCRDQIGRGKDASTWTANTVNPAPVQAAAPAYLFANRRGAAESAVYVHNGTGAWIVADRDYYTTTSTTSTDCPANSEGSCTKGVGCGTLANRPATCATGVAYWATNQSNCSDLTGYVGDSTQRTSGIATKIEGSLYKCVANAWEETPSYTPYTYPHPLREDAGTDETAPTLVSATINAAGTSLYLVFTEPVTVNTNTGFVLTATGSPSLTYSSGAGTATLVYTISAAVYQSETGITLAYTTGADYIEDAVGNDLGSFTGTAVTNQSIQVETPPTLTLTISSHTGAVVTSTPSGLNCGSTCSADFENGTVVTVGGYCLQNYATLAIGGDCAANGTVTVNGAKSCTATCTKISPDVAIGSGAAVTLGSGAVGTLY